MTNSFAALSDGAKLKLKLKLKANNQEMIHFKSQVSLLKMTYTLDYII